MLGARRAEHHEHLEQMQKNMKLQGLLREEVPAAFPLATPGLRIPWATVFLIFRAVIRT